MFDPWFKLLLLFSRPSFFSAFFTRLLLLCITTTQKDENTHRKYVQTSQQKAENIDRYIQHTQKGKKTVTHYLIPCYVNIQGVRVLFCAANGEGQKQQKQRRRRQTEKGRNSKTGVGGYWVVLEVEIHRKRISWIFKYLKD